MFMYCKVTDEKPKNLQQSKVPIRNSYQLRLSKLTGALFLGRLAANMFWKWNYFIGFEAEVSSKT